MAQNSWLASLLLSVDLHPLLNGLVLLLARLAAGGAKDQLRDEPPVAGDVVRAGDGRVNDGVVVLQGGAEAEGLEAGPDCSDLLADVLLVR